MAETPLLAIDVREACREKRAGKGQWTRGFVEELLTRGQRVRLYTDASVPHAWLGAPGVAVKTISTPGFLWHVEVAKDVRRLQEPPVYISPTSYIVPALIGRWAATVPVVHDLIAFRGEPHDRKAQLIERFTLGAAVKKAKHVLTVSDSTKADLLARYSSLDHAKITSVFAGPMRANAPKNEPDGRTILCVATLCPRKNQLRLIAAYASLPDALRSQWELVLVGSRGWQDEQIVQLARSTPGVRWMDYVPDAEYERMLHTCTVFALPSLYEGFGMQILDALQQGIPILTSDRGSLKEVTGDAALAVDPEKTEAISEGLKRLLAEAALRSQLASAGPKAAERFSWKRTVDLALEAIN